MTKVSLKQKVGIEINPNYLSSEEEYRGRGSTTQNDNSLSGTSPKKVYSDMNENSKTSSRREEAIHPKVDSPMVRNIPPSKIRFQNSNEYDAY